MTTDLFLGISEEDKNRMLGCLSSFSKKYKKNEIIEDFSYNSNLSGYVKRGRCQLQKSDLNGNVTVIETYEPGDIFGESFCFSETTEDSLMVVSIQNCEVTFFDNKKLLYPCGNYCKCHFVFITNIVNSILRRSGRIVIRIELLSKKNTRDKILGYFENLSKRQKSREIILPITISEMAEYLAVNRSAMMREIKKLKEENIIEMNKRMIKLN